ncbi:MAG: hypothetical protein HIU92_17780 [Proteobacteria bacterium]|nr:hypothetical protein [Pseudomonadota bacterium]
MAFSDAEKTDIRRFCGYPAYGAGSSGFQGWRFFQAYGLLEFRMNNLSAAEEAVSRTYLGTLRGLEAAVPQSAQSLDTDQAAVWTRNKDEVQDRFALLDEWRRRLCSFLGVPSGTSFADTSITLVV